MKYALSFHSPYAGEPLDFSERGRAEAAQRHATLMAIVDLLSKPERQPARHWFSARDLICLNCGISEVANADVSYGYGVSCGASDPPAQEKEPREAP